MAQYCSKQCAKAHWVDHKISCEAIGVAREKVLADHEARGGRKKDYNQMKRDLLDWSAKVPGLHSEMQLLAWKHRNEAPFIRATALHSDTNGSGVQVEMVTRRLWEEEGLYTCGSRFRGVLKQVFDAPSFCKDTEYVHRITIVHQDDTHFTDTSVHSFDKKMIAGVEIVEALTTSMRADGLANAFAWIESAYPSHSAQGLLDCIRRRAMVSYSNTTLAGLVSVPTRALNNEVAYMIMRSMELEFEVCLTGLRSATHLIGREGVIHCQDPMNNERWKVRLDDGACVSVKAVNFVCIRRGEYKRVSP